MDWISVFLGTGALVSGIPMVLFPSRKRRAALRAWQGRLDELRTGATETFFEERRSLEAYPPHRTDRMWRLTGLVLILSGVTLLAAAYYR